MRSMTPQQLIRSAYKQLQRLTDDEERRQFHRRAVAGKPLVVHLHRWDATGGAVAVGGGLVRCDGCRRVGLRVQGQWSDVDCVTLPTSERARQFAADLERLLSGIGPAVLANGENGRAW